MHPHRGYLAGILVRYAMPHFARTSGMPGADGHDRWVDADGPGPVPGRPRAAVTALRFRAAGPGDAAGLLALKKDLDRETSFIAGTRASAPRTMRMSLPS
jgi:hypothetical protein